MSCLEDMQAPSTSLSETNPLSNLGFAEILALADAAWAHSSAPLPGNNDELDNASILTFESQFTVDPVTNPTHKLLGRHHPSLEPRFIIHDNSQDPQGTTSTGTTSTGTSSYIPCCSKRISPDTPLTPDNAIRAESRQIASMQINIEEKDPWGEEKNVPAEKLDNNGNTPNKELCDPVIEFDTVSTPLKENHNPDKGSSHDIDLTKTPQQKPRRRKHCPKVIIEGKPKRTRKPATPKPVQSKGNPTVKRNYVRRKGLSKTSTPTEVTRELNREMMPESAKTSCRRSLNFDIGARDESSAGRENATGHLGKEIGVVAQETNVGLPYDLNTSAKQASNNYLSLSEDKQAPSTSPSKSNPPGARAKAKENATGKRKYARRKTLNKSSTPPTEMTAELTEPTMPESTEMLRRRSLNFDIGARDESSAGRENLNVHISKENSVVVEEMHVGVAYDQSSCMKQTLYNYMSLPEDTQAPSTSPSKSIPPGAKLNANSVENKNKRNGQATGQDGQENSAKVLLKSVAQSNPNDSNISNSQISTIRLQKVGSKRKHSGTIKHVDTSSMNVIEAHHNGLPSYQTTFCVQFSNIQKKRRSEKGKISNTSITSSATITKDVQLTCPQEDARAHPYASSSSCRISGSQYNAARVPAISEATESVIHDNTQTFEEFILSLRRKTLNKSSTLPTEMIAELTEPTMPESTEMLRRRSLNFDIGARDESSAGRENLNVHISKENSVVVEEMHVGLAYDQSSSMKQALNNYMSLPKDTQAPSTSPSKSNPPGAKLNANSLENKNKRNDQATAQDGYENSAKLLLNSLAKSNPNDSNISNSQISTIRLQMVGSKRRHSGTIKRADMSSMNEIGAHYNEFPEYQTKFRVQFPNIQKKRRSEKGKTSNTSITSSVTTIKEVKLTCPQEVARAHPYASSSSCWIFGSEYNTAGVPATGEATESVIDDTQTFEEFILSLRRLTKRSRSPTEICDCAPLTRIRSFDTEPNYFAKQLGISDRQTSGDAERPRTCIDALVAETSASLTKKKRNKKKSALSNSAYSSTNEMQQHHNFALGNYHLPLGKPLDIAREVIWKTMQNVDALAKQFSQLVINTEARDLALHEQNALVPYIQQNQKQSSFVHGDGTVISFQGSFDPIKKQHPRPKVDLDEETDRVWKLLMLDINSHGIDGTDEDKAKQWEEERNVFCGRADSFIARMHLVQVHEPLDGGFQHRVWKLLMLDINSHGIDGMNEDQAKWWEEKRNVFRGRADSFIARMHFVQDKRFSQWIGSIVDSVLGVFLTHNVSNHLSSSPFMSLAARFLKKSSNKCKTYHGECTSLLVNKPQVHIVEPEENTKWDEKMWIHSVYDSNSEVEDLSSTEKYNIFYNSSSLRKLLKMASSTKLHEVNRQRSKLNENLSDAYGQSLGIKHDNRTENLQKSNAIQGSLEASIIPFHEYTLELTPYSGVLEVHCYDSFETEASSSGFLKNKDENDTNMPSCQTTEPGRQVAVTHSQSMLSQLHPQEQSNHMLRNLFNISGRSQHLMQKARVLDFGDPGPSPFPSSTQCRIVEDAAIEEDPGPPSSPIQRQASSPVQHHGAGGTSIEEDPSPPFSPIQDQAAEGTEASKRGFTPSPPRRTHDVITPVAMLLPEDSSGGSAAYASVPLVDELGQLVPGHLSTDHASLLNPFFERHPQMRLADKLSSRVKGFAYTCLANLLLFLQSHSTFQALTSRHAVFMDLLQDVRSFSFDTKWCHFVEKSLVPHTCPAGGLDNPQVIKQNTTLELDAVCAEIDQSTRRLAQLHERRAYLMKLLEALSLQEGIVQSALDILLDF